MGFLVCRDPDTGDGIGGYSVDSNTLIAIENTGEIIVSRKLDREVSFTVFIHDKLV